MRVVLRSPFVLRSVETPPGDAEGHIVDAVRKIPGKKYAKPDGGESVAYTPTGDYMVERRVDGLREAALGTLSRPLYFPKGWAIHGSSSVPGYPASHGCVRTANVDQDFVFSALPDGAPIVIYGHSPGEPTEEAGF